jgi:hypothetical protein
VRETTPGKATGPWLIRTMLEAGGEVMLGVPKGGSTHASRSFVVTAPGATRATTGEYVGLNAWDTVPTHTYIHTYISQDQPGPVHGVHNCQILDLPVLELNPLNFNLFFFLFSTSQKGAFHQIVKRSKNLPYETLFLFKKDSNL